jgi:N-acetyl-anhydromuramoyl-L-alanine amidase
MRIAFPARHVVVQQVQRSLGLKADGDDRRATWQAIAERLPLSPVPRIPDSPDVRFPGRDELTKRVQRALGGILVDGHDGQETWAALAERFDPFLTQLPAGMSPAQFFQPGRYEERVVSCPNRNAGINECRGVVVHHASGYYDGTVSWCLQKGTKAGYHVLINTDGRRTVMGEDTARLHHAGQSTWRGRSGCNAFMLGLAFIGNTNDGAMRGAAGADLTKDEVASALEWLRPRMGKYGWTRSDLTTHRIVSPGRKDDTSIRALNQIHAAL